MRRRWRFPPPIVLPVLTQTIWQVRAWHADGRSFTYRTNTEADARCRAAAAKREGFTTTTTKRKR
jgi:hypothetical protein